MKRLLTQRSFFMQASAFLMFITLLGFVLQYGADIFIPLSFSFLLAFIVLPLSQRLENKGAPRWVGTTIGIAAVMLIIVGVVCLLSYQLSGLLDNLPTFKARMNTKILELQKHIGSQWGITVKEQNSLLNDQMSGAKGGSGEMVRNFFMTTTSVLLNALLVPILSFFILIFRDRFKTFLQLVDEEYSFHTFYILSEIGKVSQSYLKGVMIDTVILAVLNFAGFWYFGLEYALLFAVLAAVMNIIPYVGGLVGSLIPVALAFVTMDNTWDVMGILGVGLVVQFLDNNFIGPKVIGSSVSVNALFSTLAMMVGAVIWGIAGMLLAMPLVGMLKVVFDNIPSLKPYGYLMGEEKNYEHRPMYVNQHMMHYLRGWLNNKNKKEEETEQTIVANE
jgi:predicted PurR-regulated permease PerM